MCAGSCVCVCECMYAYIRARSVCAPHRLDEINRNTTPTRLDCLWAACQQASLMLLSFSSFSSCCTTGYFVWTSRTTLFAKSLQWMAPEVEARWKLGHMTASRKAR